MSLSAGSRLGPYEIVGPLGSGGMGEVYRAHDPRLDRDVAVKVLPSEMSGDPDRRRQLEREARAIGAINHPNICALYDVGHDRGVDFLVMELLEGESLAARLGRGPVPSDEAVRVGLAIVEALQALHERNLVHRDLKPSNVFLSRHGVKLLDFGLARPQRRTDAVGDHSITQPGMLVGTPRYMAPEQVKGGPIDARTDVFAAAAVIYEMLAGRAPFEGDTLVEVLHAVAYEEPPPLPAGVAPEALECALRQALSKDPADRPASSEAFAGTLRQALAAASGVSAGVGPVPPRRAATRVIVLPLRILRPDAETDFLAFSLADAVAASLASLDSLTVRSSLTAARFADQSLDLQRLAEEAGVDVALTGSLLRAGGEIRVAAQLVEVPQGSLVWSRTIQAPVQDLFQLQDTLTNAIVSSLELPLTARDRSVLKRDVPADPRAYELFLRGNQLMMESSRWAEVRDLYEESVRRDPGYAPAWAQLGRVLRVIAKYGGAESEGERARAERAFERALALNPDLAMAHHLYTYLEVELGRAPDAMVRLLTRARAHRSDPDIFAALVITCRYCGLLDASIAADERARQLDPAVRTSVAYTYLLRGEFERAETTDPSDPPFAALVAKARGGRAAEAVAAFRALENTSRHRAVSLIALAYRAVIEARLDELAAGIKDIRATNFRDPEGYYLVGAFAAAAGACEIALNLLGTAVSGGYHCPSAMASDAAWDACRDNPVFHRLQAQAQAGRDRALARFLQAGGPALLETTS